jgi:hypothetical protein
MAFQFAAVEDHPTIEQIDVVAVQKDFGVAHDGAA